MSSFTKVLKDIYLSSVILFTVDVSLHSLRLHHHLGQSVHVKIDRYRNSVRGSTVVALLSVNEV